VFRQTDQEKAQALLATLMSLESKQCSDYIKEFACAAAFPQCTNNGRLLHPCRDFCFGKLAHVFHCQVIDGNLLVENLEFQTASIYHLKKYTECLVLSQTS